MRKRIIGQPVLAVLVLLAACASPRYIIYSRPATAWNGSFEIVESGYPVNWSFSQSPIEQRDMILVLDRGVVHEGQQSLRVEVLRAAAGREVFQQVWAKPSFSTRATIEPGSRYRLSFWLRDERAKVHVRWVTTSKDYQKHSRFRDVLETSLATAEWTLVEDEITAEEGEQLLELIFVVSEPGLFWCDDVRVEEVAGDG
jgi:hypothetical protein